MVAGAGFSFSVIDGDRLYQIDNSANIGAFDLSNGSSFGRKPSDDSKASPVLSPTASFMSARERQVLHSQTECYGLRNSQRAQLGTAALPEAVMRSAAVANGRVYFVR